MPRVYVPIDKITSARQLDAKDDLNPLRESMMGRGMERAPLLTPDLEIVDGLKRIEVLRGWNHRGQILCVVTDDWEEILRYLEEETEINGPIRLRRAGEIYLQTRAYGAKLSHRLRGNRARGVKNSDRLKGAIGQVHSSMVHGYAVAVGASRDYLIENQVDFLRIRDFKLSPQLREEWDRLSVMVDAGDITPGGARNRMRRMLRSPLGIRSSEHAAPVRKMGKGAERQQLNAVRHAIGTLEGTISGLNQMSNLGQVIEGFEPEELKIMVKRIEEFRRQTGHVLNVLRARRAAE